MKKDGLLYLYNEHFGPLEMPENLDFLCQSYPTEIFYLIDNILYISETRFEIDMGGLVCLKPCIGSWGEVIALYDHAILHYSSIDRNHQNINISIDQESAIFNMEHDLYAAVDKKCVHVYNLSGKTSTICYETPKNLQLFISLRNDADPESLLVGIPETLENNEAYNEFYNLLVGRYINGLVLTYINNDNTIIKIYIKDGTEISSKKAEITRDRDLILVDCIIWHISNRFEPYSSTKILSKWNDIYYYSGSMIFSNHLKDFYIVVNVGGEEYLFPKYDNEYIPYSTLKDKIPVKSTRK